MDSDPVPFFANLLLFYYENKWVKKVKKSDIIEQGDLLMYSGSLTTLLLLMMVENFNGVLKTPILLNLSSLRKFKQ